MLLRGDAREWLGENISKVFLGWNLDKSNLPFHYPFPDVVVSNIDMLRTRVSFGIKGEGDGGGVFELGQFRT